METLLSDIRIVLIVILVLMVVSIIWARRSLYPQWKSFTEQLLQNQLRQIATPSYEKFPRAAEALRAGLDVSMVDDVDLYNANSNLIPDHEATTVSVGRFEHTRLNDGSEFFSCGCCGTYLTQANSDQDPMFRIIRAITPNDIQPPHIGFFCHVCGAGVVRIADTNGTYVGHPMWLNEFTKTYRTLKRPEPVPEPEQKTDEPEPSPSLDG